MRRSTKKWNIFLNWLMIMVALAAVSGCESYKEKSDKLSDTPRRGKIYISADESFKPVIDAQVEVYESNYPGTEIVVQYKPEAECIKDFAVDSIRMVIITRGYSPGEEKYIIESLKLAPQMRVIAQDAIAVIVHPDAPDTLFTMDEIREVLSGRFKKNLIPVFDGVQATSTVRYIVDSVLRDDSLTSKAVAARSSEGVINYVAQNPEAIGFIGVSWVGNKEDSMQVSFLENVKIAHLESTDSADTYILPVQENIYLRRYPMVRDLVYIRKERHRGLAFGFVDFLNSDPGQLIFKRAYLVPAHKNFILRPVRLVE